MSNGGTSQKKPSFDVLFEISKYALDNEWDLFKVLDSKARIILTASTTILSIYIGILIFFSDSIIKTSSLIEVINVYYWVIISPLALFIFLTSLNLVLSIYYSLNCLKITDFARAPDPIEVTNKFKYKDEIRTKLAVTKSMMKAWYKNHNGFNLDKQEDTNKSFVSLYRAIIFLIISLFYVGILILCYNLYGVI